MNLFAYTGSGPEPKIIQINPCLSKLQLAKVGTFFFETQCISRILRTLEKINLILSGFVVF